MFPFFYSQKYRKQQISVNLGQNHSLFEERTELANLNIIKYQENRTEQNRTHNKDNKHHDEVLGAQDDKI